MSRIRLTTIAALLFAALIGSPAYADDDPITVGGGDGIISTGIYVPGSPGTRTPIVQPTGGGTGSGPAIMCTYTPDGSPDHHPWDDVPGHIPGVNGNNYFRSCSDGTFGVVWVPNGAAPPAPGVPTVTPLQLALEARDALILTHPSVHRSPTETNDYHGNPFTWVNLWTWFWTDAADYQAISHTVTAGPISATVVARPVGLLFDPGDGGDAVRCPGPGQPWTDADGNDAPASGCGYQYRHVTDGAITSRLGILWRVTWTGTGGTGGTLPTMETITAAPLRVLQVQVVNR